MTITLWILSGSLFITVVLYTIGLIKNIPLMQKISSGFIIPMIEAVTLIMLARYLPDSFHILLVTVIALFLTSTAEILFLFNNISILQTLSKILFLLSQICWMDIYKSTFFINRIPTWLSSISLVFYLLIICGVCFITGKQKLSIIVTHIISMIIIFTVNYCTFITLCFESSLYSLLQFAGTLSACALVIYYIFNHTRFDFKYKNFVLLILLIISQGLLSAGNILMIG